MAATTIAAPNPKTRQKLAAAPFAATLHGQVGKQSGNLIFSPASISMALAMTREGASGKTAAEMDGVLGAAAGADARALAKSLTGKPAKAQPGGATGPEISIANRLYGDAATPFLPRFLDLTRTAYNAPLEAVDFRKNAEAARVAINAWVASQTRDRIKDLLAPGIVTSLTRLVLVNAIYLRAQWETPFEARNTRAAAFTIEGTKAPKQIATMNGEVPARVGEHGGARTLDLPYRAGAEGPRLGMLIVMPKSVSLSAIEKTYTREGLAGFLADTKGQADVNVALPKFKIGTELDLGESLKALGMKRAFVEGEAEFGGMTSAAKLFISKVVHKAWIAVDESGTEAAAATAVVMNGQAARMPNKPVDFKVDRSFAFFVHDEKGNVLFAGRVLDPSAS